MRTYDEGRLAELIVYFAKYSEKDLFFGSTKLNKLLFVADFLAYGYLGQSITGATYIHQKQGPTPEPSQFLAARETLISTGRLRIQEEDTYSGTRKRPVTDDYPNLHLFDKRELQICEAAIESLKHMNNLEISEWSHGFLGWLYTKEGEEIPYYMAYMWGRTEPTKDDFEWANNMLQEFEVA